MSLDTFSNLLLKLARAILRMRCCFIVAILYVQISNYWHAIRMAQSAMEGTTLVAFERGILCWVSIAYMA